MTKMGKLSRLYRPSAAQPKITLSSGSSRPAAAPINARLRSRVQGEQPPVLAAGPFDKLCKLSKIEDFRFLGSGPGG